MNLTQIKGNTWVLEGQEFIPLYRLDERRCVLLDNGLVQEQEELEESFRTQLNQYQQGNQGGETASAGYTLVTLAQGQVMRLEVGCEVLLRVGSASVQADSSPALIDLSSAGTVGAGTSLEKNHLYMSTIEGRTLTADAGTVKLLVRGGYTVA